MTLCQREPARPAYDGDLEYEERYLHTCSQSMGNVMLLALQGNQVIGASTAIPFEHEAQEVKSSFVAAVGMPLVNSVRRTEGRSDNPTFLE